MNIFSFLERNYFNFFLLLFTFISVYASLNTGITHDEKWELHNFQLNKNIISNFFFNLNLNTEYLYGEKTHMNAFYGIGFHLISFPLEQIISFFDFNCDLTKEGRLQLIKHPSIIILFVISSIYFRKLIYLITKKKNYASICTIFYLLYPYLLGHNYFNIKDAPFMSVWLICTFCIIDIIKKFNISKEILLRKVILLAILTSILVSIRIVGILIFLEYLIFSILLFKNSDIDFKKFFKKIFKPLIIFSILIIGLIFILHPHFWNSPKSIVYALDFFKNHVQTVCTVTLGECMKAQNLPSSYLPIWFFYKLPIIILIGLLVYPLIEKKLFVKKINSIIILGLILTVMLIVFILIFSKAVLYDELRQVMFLIPLMMIVSFVSIYYFLSKKFLYTIIISYILFFTFQNFKIYPYNYIWLNNFSSFLNVNKNFVLDYWGASTKRVGKFLKNEISDNKICTISNRNHGISYYTDVNFNNCFIPFSELDKKQARPFYVALLERKLNKGTPNGCKKIYEEKIKLNFSKEELILAKVFRCN